MKKIPKIVDNSRENKINYSFYVDEETAKIIEQKYAEHRELKKYVFITKLVMIGLKHFDEEVNK